MNQLDLFGSAPNSTPPGKTPRPTPAGPPAPHMCLVDILAGGDTVLLRRTDHQRRDNPAELRLMVRIGQLLNCDVAEFCAVLKRWLRATPQGNGTNYYLSYKIIEQVAGVEIWHTNAEGEPNRHVCSLSQLN